MLLQVPPTFAPFLVASGLGPAAFREAVLWVVLALLLDGRRFLGVVREFLEEAGLLSFSGARAPDAPPWGPVLA
jgi:hypothetical protein